MLRLPIFRSHIITKSALLRVTNVRRYSNDATQHEPNTKDQTANATPKEEKAPDANPHEAILKEKDAQIADLKVCPFPLH
jgi:hypothetical protein